MEGKLIIAAPGFPELYDVFLFIYSTAAAQLENPAPMSASCKRLLEGWQCDASD